MRSLLLLLSRLSKKRLVYFFVKTPARGGPLIVLDVSSSPENHLRPGNESCDYVLIGWKK